MSKESGDKNVDKRLGRMTVFRGLAGEQAIEATSKDGMQGGAGPDDHDSGPAPNDSDTDAGPRRPPATDSDKPARQSATDSDQGRSHPRDREAD